MSNKRNVTFVGLGTMGYPMAGHLSRSGLFNVSVFNRSSEKIFKNGEMNIRAELQQLLKTPLKMLMLLLHALEEMKI